VTVNYDGRLFRAVANTENGETTSETIFAYRQSGTILSATYGGGRIITGHLLGLVHDDGSLDFRYHQINDRNEIMTGQCASVPEVLPDGRIRLHETWQWTSGDHSSGTSIVEELPAEPGASSG
jgi:hypothetical protein